MTEKESWLDEVGTDLRTFTVWGICGLIDSSFLILWVATQWGTSKVLSQIAIEGIDIAVFYVFQILFALSTLAPVMMYIYGNITIYWIRTKKQIESEKRRQL